MSSKFIVFNARVHKNGIFNLDNFTLLVEIATIKDSQMP